MEQETRRGHSRNSHHEAVNSNTERRRIQSVTAGFQTLITQLPQQEGEKLRQIVIDPNAFDDFADPHLPEAELGPGYNVYIPPRTHGAKRKKSKGRRRHSETIWTIVSEQENQHPQFATTTKPSSVSSTKHKSKSKRSVSKDRDKEAVPSSPVKHIQEVIEKKGKSKKKHSKDSTASFLDNPIFDTDLKHWTLPRVELWCKDPQCQINVQLWRDYCQTHQSELTQLQVQELLNQQHQYAHQQQLQQQQHICNHHHQPPPPPAPPLPQHQHKQHPRFITDAALPPDLPAPASLSRRQRISTISHILEGATSNGHTIDPHPLPNSGCAHHQQHHHHQYQQQSEEEEAYYSHQYGNMHINMSIGASMNNLNGHRPHPQQDSGVGTPSSSTSASSKNNIIPTALPQSSGGGSSAKTASTSVGPSSPSSVEGGGGPQVKKTSRSRSNMENNADAGGSTRDNYSGSTSSSTSSSSSSTSGDDSSGSTFVTGFESSDSRGSSVPSSLNKPPHPNLLEASSNNSNNKTSTNNHHHHRTSKSHGDNAQTTTVATTAASGYPSVPYIPAAYRKPGICPSCNGLVPPPSSSTNHHLIPVDPILSAAGRGGTDTTTLGVIPHHHHTTGSHQYHHNITSASANKSDNAFWNFSKFQHPLQRDHSFHSVGGFTLNGQYNTQVKQRRIVKFCSSHKIALVVSTFSLMVTIGLIITLILMKKRGMMDTMDMMPT